LDLPRSSGAGLAFGPAATLANRNRDDGSCDRETNSADGEKHFHDW
jgi:hypothetical protein